MPNLSDFGIDLTMVQEKPIEAITFIHRRYEEAAKAYRDAGEKNTTGIKAVVQKVKSDEPATVNLANDLMTQLRKITYEVLLNDPAVSVLLFDQLQDLKDGISAFRQEAMRNITVDSDSDEEEVDTEAMYENVEFLHKALSNFVNFAQMNGLTTSQLPINLTEVNKKSNKREVKLPRKPNGPESKEGDSTKGRHAAIYKMEYWINGTDADNKVPSGISLNRLALFYCSTPSEWINGSELMEAVEKQNEGKSWGAMETFTVKVPAGTLIARKVKSS